MDTSKDVFRTLYSKKWYRTIGFNELALDFASHMSYRQAAQKLNRVRNEKTSVPVSVNKAKVYVPDKRKIRIPHKIKDYNKNKPDELKIRINQQENFYENLDNTINISIEDVSVKKQKSEYSLLRFKKIIRIKNFK